MDRLEQIKLLYTQLGETGLTELVHSGKVTIEEYETVTGQDCVITVDILKQQKIKFIDNYKHVARMYFPY